MLERRDNETRGTESVCLSRCFVYCVICYGRGFGSYFLSPEEVDSGWTYEFYGAYFAYILYWRCVWLHLSFNYCYNFYHHYCHYYFFFYLYYYTPLYVYCGICFERGFRSYFCLSRKWIRDERMNLLRLFRLYFVKGVFDLIYLF